MAHSQRAGTGSALLKVGEKSPMTLLGTSESGSSVVGALSIYVSVFNMGLGPQRSGKMK